MKSGLTWETDPAGNEYASQGRSTLRWVRSTESPHRRALFKTPGEESHPQELYSLAMDRVCYRLGLELELRVPAVWLEEIDGQHGVAIDRILEGRDLNQATRCMMLNEIVDFPSWPMTAVFDIWIANIDRLSRNVMVEALPEEVEIGTGEMLEATKGYVTPQMRPWVDEIRELGNDANHEIRLMSDGAAAELLTFVEMLLRVLYEYPERGKRSSEARKQADSS